MTIKSGTQALIKKWKTPSIIPGFGLSFGIGVSYLGLLVLVPVAAIFIKASSLSALEFIAIMSQPQILHAIFLSFWTAFVAALVNVIFGLLVAWVLVRYEFPGRRFVDACVDLPFALPTAVAGLALTALYARTGWLGKPLMEFDIAIAYTPLGIVIALIFIGLPFVVRTIQPALADFDSSVEEAAASLGAGRIRTLCSVLLPLLFPSILTGFALAFGRAVGEYGSVIFIAGNLPFKTQIAPLMIVMQLEGSSVNKYAAGAAIGVTLLVLAFIILLSLNLLQAYTNRKYKHG